LPVVIIAKNTSQGIPDINIIRNITVTPDDLYTCPVGKRAIVKGLVRCVDRGAAGTVNFKANGVIIYVWNTAAFINNQLHPAWTERPADMTTSGGGEVGVVDVILEATQTIRVDQSVGTNAQLKVILQVRELPA